MEFWKYEGAGNDFIMVDDRNGHFSQGNYAFVKLLCDRHFGIGADGLILLQSSAVADFGMIYYNADGLPGSMCGNGGRCIVDFAARFGLVDGFCAFTAADGMHEAIHWPEGMVNLKMGDVTNIEDVSETEVLLNTGSPHLVKLVNDIGYVDVLEEGKSIRYNDRFKKDGVNVNWVELRPDGAHVRTYERGVEGETLACGTGVTAAAIALHHWKRVASPVAIHARGGDLNVTFEFGNDTYFNVWKKGPVRMVYKGEWPL